MRGAVRRALEEVAEKGLPGNHHFYITFLTRHPAAAVPPRLAAQYPETMTIVLQHQYYGLEVHSTHFEVTLSFNRVQERLHIPWEAVTVFHDPSVDFGLRFSRQGSSRSCRSGKPGPAAGRASRRAAREMKAAMAAMSCRWTVSARNKGRAHARIRLPRDVPARQGPDLLAPARRGFHRRRTVPGPGLRLGRSGGADPACARGLPRHLAPAPAGPPRPARLHPRRPRGLAQRPLRRARPAEEREYRRGRRAAHVPGTPAPPSSWARRASAC